jgi:glycosyltransferase involved in cell wall biosynthesis
MRVAILGSRGIPACYSGYDTLVEELSFGLAESDEFDVLVYCRTAYYKDRPNTLHGVHLVYLPTPRLKAIESLLHSFLSTLHVILQNVDVVYFVDPANAPFCIILRLLGKKVVVHTDGLGWKRRKWGLLARNYYKFVEWLCARTANALITDNPEMQNYYKREYNADSTYISYGASNDAGVDENAYNECTLVRGFYLLVVARLEPENNVDFIIEEYVRSRINMPLIIVGDSPYNPSYLEHLRKTGDTRVRFLGRIHDQAKLNALYEGAFLYIHGHEVGGTNPSLLRAMHAGAAPLVLNVPFNTSVVADCGFVFERKSGCLTGAIDRLTADPALVRQIGDRARARAKVHFTWDAVIAAHEQLFRLLTGEERSKTRFQSF